MNNMETGKFRYDDLGTKAYDMLKEMIINGDLKPGQKLIQEEIAELLGVSRTPLLQAISKLSKDHYIETIPRRGSFVNKFSAQEILDIFDIRGQLEPMGTFYAAEKITASEIKYFQNLIKETEALIYGSESPDPLELFEYDYKFHMSIMEISGNYFLHDFLQNLNNILSNSERILKSPKKTLEEHIGILNALQNHDANGAKELMFYHIHGGARTRLAQLLASSNKS